MILKKLSQRRREAAEAKRAAELARSEAALEPYRQQGREEARRTLEILERAWEHSHRDELRREVRRELEAERDQKGFGSLPIWLNQEDYEQLEELAFARAIPMTTLAIQVLEEWIAEKQR